MSAGGLFDEYAPPTCGRPDHIEGCPGSAGGDHKLSEPRARLCPACGILAAAPGDRYCVDCGSARDRSAWADDR